MRDTLCTLCGREEESTSHILISCKVSIVIWNMCNRWLGISWVYHNELVNHFEQFFCICFNKEGNRLRKSLWVLAIWCIWKHRNITIFNQAKRDAEEILTMAQIQLWAWMKHKVSRVKFSFSNWILSPITYINGNNITC